MIYRVLGVVSLTIGGIFGLVALLVLLPFIDNFNMSLLVLCGVFGILAYVFLAIGWQLFHPPAARGRRSGEEVASAGAKSTALTPVVLVGPSAVVAASPTESESAPVVPSAGGAADVRTAAPAPRLSPNGGNSEQAHSAPGAFKKPGAPVPHK